MFHRPSFSPVSFSLVSFNGARQPIAQDGRSGYWRLFYYQMQEAELAKRDMPATRGIDDVIEEKMLKALRAEKPRAKKQPTKVVQTVVEKLPPLPAPTRLDDQPNYIAHAWRITLELRRLVSQHRNIAVQYQHTLDAANDDDEEELFLLLLSA